MTRSRVTVCLPDLHAPQHDPRALRWALDYTVDAEPRRVILLGDVVDFLALSRFPKSPEQSAALDEELVVGRRVLKQIDRALADVPIVWIAGNHEARVQKYLYKKAPELCGLPELSVPRLLNMPERWTYIAPGGHIWEQGILVQHGNRYAQNTCVAYLNEYGCSVVAGHSHRANQMTRRLQTGKTITAIESGCLCAFTQNYSA